MDCEQFEQEVNVESERCTENASVSPIMSCPDDNLNYTYAKSCEGGICLL